MPLVEVMGAVMVCIQMSEVFGFVGWVGLVVVVGAGGLYWMLVGMWCSYCLVCRMTALVLGSWPVKVTSQRMFWPVSSTA